MEMAQESGSPAPEPGGWMHARTAHSRSRGLLRLKVRDVQLYHVCEFLTEGLIYLMVIFSPWAFGTTEDWSIHTMNAGGYVLGVLLAVKLGIRRLKGYRPSRWDAPRPHSAHASSDAAGSANASSLVVLAVLTVGILAYCLVSALNALYVIDSQTFDAIPRDNYIPWLPYSLDANRSWPAFWNYLALACSFWAIVDWLPGKTASEDRAEGPHSSRARSGTRSGPLFPARLRRLLWLLAINGGLLGLEGIAQRIEGSGLLLFMVPPAGHPMAGDQFGPYAYRSNAAQYFNLVWPVCVGFWWMLNRRHGFRQAGHHVVLACGLIMAACPIISTTLAGAAVSVGMLVATPLLLLAVDLKDGFGRGKRRPEKAALFAILFMIGTLGLGQTLGGKALAAHLAHFKTMYAYRQRMYDAARQMADYYPAFGTGPGTFATAFSLFPKDKDTPWYEQVHNDWLETRITFGYCGSALIALAFLTVLLRWFGRGGIHGGRRFVFLMWLSLAGCLAQARWDFPFQIYSIVFLALVLCAILANLTRKA